MVEDDGAVVGAWVFCLSVVEYGVLGCMREHKEWAKVRKGGDVVTGWNGHWDVEENRSVGFLVALGLLAMRRE